MKTKYCRTTKNRPRRNQRSRSLAHRQQNKERPTQMEKQDNGNNIQQTEETLRTKEPQEHMKKEKTWDWNKHTKKGAKKAQEQTTQKTPETRKRNTEMEHRELHYVTIQTRGGSHEAGLIIDNTNNCQLQEKLNMTRYRIPQPPQLTHNIPRFYTAKKLSHRQVLKFDIREPGPHRQIWRKKDGSRTRPSRMYRRS